MSLHKTIIAAAAAAAMTLGCAAGDTTCDDCDDDDGGSSAASSGAGVGGGLGVGSGPSSGVGPSGAGGGSTAPPDFSQCSEFSTIASHFGYLNDQRSSYAPHDRYRGIPWQGGYHTNETFPLRFAWSDELAATAQAEAQRLAQGGSPAGIRVPGQDPWTRELYIDGINSASWRVTVAEHPGDWDEDSLTGNSSAALKSSNGSARLGFFYHDFGGDGPVITQAGLGGAIADGCIVWWVVQMAP